MYHILAATQNVGSCLNKPHRSSTKSRQAPGGATRNSGPKICVPGSVIRPMRATLPLANVSKTALRLPPETTAGWQIARKDDCDDQH
jgi:hypothetical protein